MKDLLSRFDFCVFDLETTGLKPGENCGIIEVGAVKIRGDSDDVTFQSLADPGHSVPPEITEITGITDEDIAGSSRSEDVVGDFLDFAGDSILIAHNAPFDLSFLEYSAPDPIEHDHIDTLRLSRQLISAESHSLSNLVETLGLSLERAHRALDDALATRDLFLHLSEQISKPEDYLRCNLPPRILEVAPVDVSSPGKPNGYLNNRQSSDPLAWILYALYELDSRIGVTKLAQILTGSSSRNVESYTTLDSYGQLADYTQSELKDAIKEALSEGYVEQTGDPYPVLNLTDRGIGHLRDHQE